MPTCRSISIGAALFALAIGMAAAMPGPATAHQSGCHSAHTCPSDHHTYVWNGLSCTSYPDERLPSDTTVVTVDGRTYYCTKVSSGGSPAPAAPSTDSAPACGVERWAVKTLTDPAAAKIVVSPRTTSVAALTQLAVPHVGADTPRIVGIETRVYRVRARLVEAKIEADSDVHLVIADLAHPKVTMIAELPADGCTKGAPPALRRQMSAARAAFAKVCGTPSKSRFTALGGTGVLTGVGFVDEIHGQRGVAPNGIELHPLLSFRTTGCRGSGTA